MGKSTFSYHSQIVPRITCRQAGPHLVFSVRCPYCGRRHYHGAGGGFGPRVAHCPDLAPGRPVPGRENGYILVSH